MSWQTVNAGELMVKRGGSVDPSKYPDEIFDLLSIPAFDKGQIEILSGSEIGSSKINVEPNDVLLAKIIPHIRRCWVVPEKSNRRQIGSGEWIVFRDKRFYPDFLKHFLTSDIFHKQFMGTVAGVGGSLVRARPAAVEKIEIPLPPLEEQKRIAAILDKADAIRRKRQQAIKLADDFLRSVFLEMFGDPVTNPKGWEIDYLPNIGTFKNGLNYGKDESGVSISCLGVGDFKSLDRIDSVQLLSKVSLDSYPSEDYLLKDGDLVFVRSNGNGALVGRCLSVYPGSEKLTFSGFCIRFRVTRKGVYPNYLNHLFRIPSIKHEMLKGGQGANIQNINQQKLSEIKVPIPPEQLQIKFATLVKAFRDSLNRKGSSLDAVQNLFSSLSQKAFSGEL